MTKGYVFNAGAQKAISIDPKGDNLPAPKVGEWKFDKVIPDVNARGLTAVDPEAIAKNGYQIYPAPKDSDFLGNQDVLGTKDILK